MEGKISRHFVTDLTPKHRITLKNNSRGKFSVAYSNSSKSCSLSVSHLLSASTFSFCMLSETTLLATREFLILLPVKREIRNQNGAHPGA